jgi:hypothetical protein
MIDVNKKRDALLMAFTELKIPDKGAKIKIDQNII